VLLKVYGDYYDLWAALEVKNKAKTNPISVSPQHCCGVEKPVEKTKPILR
jgi:hypothetical protein